MNKSTELPAERNLLANNIDEAVARASVAVKAEDDEEKLSKKRRGEDALEGISDDEEDFDEDEEENSQEEEAPNATTNATTTTSGQEGEKKAEQPLKKRRKVVQEHLGPYTESCASCGVCGEPFMKVFRGGEWWVTGVTLVDKIHNVALTPYAARRLYTVGGHGAGRGLPEGCIIYHRGCVPKSIAKSGVDYKCGAPAGGRTSAGPTAGA